MPDGDGPGIPLPVVLYGLRSIDLIMALAAKTQGRWVVFAPYPSGGTPYCSLP